MRRLAHSLATRDRCGRRCRAERARLRLPDVLLGAEETALIDGTKLGICAARRHPCGAGRLRRLLPLPPQARQRSGT